jgi:hypothetical protein
MMDIRIRKSFKGFFVERLNDRNEWRYWLPKDGEEDFRTGQEALQAAREERDAEIYRECAKISSYGESVELKI